jgi:hypothetical protein
VSRLITAYARHSLAVDIKIVDRHGAADAEGVQQVTRGVKGLQASYEDTAGFQSLPTKRGSKTRKKHMKEAPNTAINDSYQVHDGISSTWRQPKPAGQQASQG